ncbi:MAG: BMC domain-containing protein [Pirellulaceae bacterium]
MHQSLGIVEVTGFTPAMVALDAMEKAAGIEVLQAELNDFYGVCLKIVGPPANVAAALAAGQAVAEQMGGRPVADIIHRPDDQAMAGILSKPEVSPLIQQSVVMIPGNQQHKESHVAESSALGFIETQGFTAVFEAIDSACKAANVEVVGKEKLGGGYITIVVRGDVAAVKAAIDAGKSRVEGLGKLIAAHVIARPSAAVLALLPKG